MSCPAKSTRNQVLFSLLASRAKRWARRTLILLAVLTLCSHHFSGSIRAQGISAHQLGGDPTLFMQAERQAAVGEAAWSGEAGMDDGQNSLLWGTQNVPVWFLDAPGADPMAPAAAADFESDVIQLVNAERAKVGCPALTAHPTLRQVAYGHCKDMANRDFFDHVNPDGDDFDDRVNKTNYVYSALGENIAAGYGTPAAVMDGWMNSEGHRRNILNCDFQDIGVGYYYDADSEYGHYWTQLFGRQFGGGTRMIHVTVTSPASSGTVTSSPSGINCGSGCSVQFSFNATVSLTALPATGYRFAGWGGDCSGMQATCQVVMNADRSVTAVFTSAANTDFIYLPTIRR